MSTFHQAENLEAVLRRLNAKLFAWQVRALFLGAHASTNVRLGLQHLLGHIFGDSPVLGGSIEEASANLQVLTDTWNSLIANHQRGCVRLSLVEMSNPPVVSELQALIERRNDELHWFVKGIDAGGDDPFEFGPDGEAILARIAEGSALFEKYREFLRDHDCVDQDDALSTARDVLEGLTQTVERLIADLMTISNGVRRRAIAAHAAIEGRLADDGAMVARRSKVRRNASCPCGSGRKWKRCCGAPARLQ